MLVLLRDLGSSFDVASRYELDQLLGLGVDPLKISFGNTIKKADDIVYFYKHGVRLYANDSAEDLANISKYALDQRSFSGLFLKVQAQTGRFQENLELILI